MRRMLGRPNRSLALYIALPFVAMVLLWRAVGLWLTHDAIDRSATRAIETELLTGRRMHPVQYLLVGLALSLFFLLLLSLSEHLPFLAAYLIAAGAAAAVLTQYAAAMLGGWLRGLAFGGGIALLYGALYVLLSREQTALVIGAVLLFAVLAVVMTLTRRLDWFRLSSGRQQGE